MEDILDVLKLSDEFNEQLELIRVQCLSEVRQLLGGTSVPVTTLAPTDTKAEIVDKSPFQTKKRVKRLSSLQEDETEEETSTRHSVRASNSKLLAAAAAAIDEDEEKENNQTGIGGNILDSTSSLMPPPPVPDVSQAQGGRPQRAAKLNCKSFKEPTLISKLRRPSKNEEIKIKLEQEQRKSQFESAAANSSEKSNTHTLSETITAIKSLNIETENNKTVEDDSDKKPESTQASTEEGNKSLQGENKIRIKVKREKLSNGEANNTQQDNSQREVDNFKTPLQMPPPTGAAAAPAHRKKDVTTSDESTLLSSTVSNVNTTTNSMDTVAPTKKHRKKKDVPHRPIKVERFSEIEVSSPIARRTRRGNSELRTTQAVQKSQSQRSIYEDAIGEHISPTAQAVPANPINETVNLPNATMTLGASGTPETDAIFALPNANATITIEKNVVPGDTTFDVAPAKNNNGDSKRSSSSSSNGSMVTAKAGSIGTRHDSIMTEDNSFENEAPQPVKAKQPTTTKGGNKPLPIPQMHVSASASKPLKKMTTRAQELFNPNMQSPVKLRVEAFEYAAQAAAAEEPRKNMRSRVAKDNTSSSTTPVIGKLPLPTLGRFLTPTQSSNLPLASSAQPKKAPMSASKVSSMLPKSATASNFKSTVSTSTKNLSRENSNDDFRKGLHQLAEERKKQREQKHLLAAKQREAKERERAERIANLEKERAEKRLRKVKEQEQTRRELEELNRKIKQQEEAEALKKAEAIKKAKAKAAQEQEMLQQMKQQQLLEQQQQQQAKHKQMLPPAPKAQTKYTFEMLHEDDSTDDEGKVSYKRPPVPSWSRSHVRSEAIQLQQYCPTEVIDSFFSVQPTTPDLKEIFPNIDPRHLKRNSSVLWSTPPRYSELPKY